MSTLEDFSAVEEATFSDKFGTEFSTLVLSFGDSDIRIGSLISKLPFSVSSGEAATTEPFGLSNADSKSSS